MPTVNVSVSFEMDTTLLAEAGLDMSNPKDVRKFRTALVVALSEANLSGPANVYLSALRRPGEVRALMSMKDEELLRATVMPRGPEATRSEYSVTIPQDIVMQARLLLDGAGTFDTSEATPSDLLAIGGAIATEKHLVNASQTAQEQAAGLIRKFLPTLL